MAKIKTICLYLLCFAFCFSAAGQSAVSKREQVRQVYSSQVGIVEKGGANRGKEVAQYLASTGLGPGYPWCAAFVSWCFQQAQVENPGSAWVPAYFTKSKMIYLRGKFQSKIPETGDVFSIWYARLNRPAHIGFVDKWGKDWIVTVEGNTNEGGSREGMGVFKKRRLRRQVYAVSDFIGRK
jgi:hypothetical protein